MKAKRRRKIILIIVLIIIGLLAAGRITAMIADGRDKTGEVLEGYDDPSYRSEKDIKKTLSWKKSDIKGMSMYDKYKKGLIPMDGSDTDRDGLTDRQEIEVYHSDPLKASTAGDMYTDSEKVEKGLNLKKKVSYKGSPVYYGNNTKNAVIFEGKTADDRFTKADDVTGMDVLKGHKIYKEYLISDCGVAVKVDLSKALKKYDNVKDSDVKIYIGEANKGNAKPVSFTIHGADEAELKYDFDRTKIYSIYVTNKTLSPLPVSKGFAYGSTFDGGADTQLDGIVYGSPLLHVISGELNVRYLEQDSSKDEDIEKKTLVKQAVKAETADMDTTSDKIKPVKKGQINTMYKFFDTILPMCNGKRDKDSPWKLFFYFDRYTNASKELSADDKKDINSDTVSSGFEIGKDSLPFGNFGTEISPGGVCAGISYYTMYLYDKGSAPAFTGDGKWSDRKEDTPWDISGRTFTNLRTKGKIGTFQDEEYIDRHTGKTGIFDKDLDTDDRSFSNMMTIYWAKWNNSVEKNSTWSYSKAISGETTGYKFSATPYDYDSVITYAKKRIDEGKVVEFGSTLGTEYSSTKEYRNGQKGHVILLIGYKDYKDGRVDFHVYDSNLPERDDLWMYTRYVQTDDVFQTDSFWYKYQPDENNNNYIMTNIKSGYYHIRVTGDDMKPVSRLARDEKAEKYSQRMIKEGVISYRMPESITKKMKKKNARY